MKFLFVVRMSFDAVHGLSYSNYVSKCQESESIHLYVWEVNYNGLSLLLWIRALCNPELPP